MLQFFSPFKDYNPIIDSDSYKDCHPFIIPENVTGSEFHIVSRGGLYPKVVAPLIQMVLRVTFGTQIKSYHVDEAEEFSLEQNGSFYRKGWDDIVNKHGGYVPMEVWAVPEGTVLPVHVPSVVLKSTAMEWTPRYYETRLQRYCWVSSTVGTRALYWRKKIYKYLLKTDGKEVADAVIDWMMNDFGSRGTKEPVFTGGGFLQAFQGTDNKAAVYCMNREYNSKMSGRSIKAATEHSIMTLLGPEGEWDIVERYIDLYGPQKCIFAMVLDSYSMRKLINEGICGKFKEKIIKYGEMGAKFVGRPDSGEPSVVLPDVVKAFMNGFGYQANGKGFNVLPRYIGAIQGDGISDDDALENIISTCVYDKIATSNYCFGSGGGALEFCDRDTQKYAMKLQASEVDGAWYGRNKCPEDAPWKASKAGQLRAYRVKGKSDLVCMTIQEAAQRSDVELAMELVYKDGEILTNRSLDEIRARLNSYDGLIL